MHSRIRLLGRLGCEGDGLRPSDSSLAQKARFD